MATLRAGMVMPEAETAAAVGLPPNHGVSLLPQPSRLVLPAMLSIFSVRSVNGVRGSSGGGATVGACPPLRRTKNPYSGARMGPLSRSAARKEKLPAFVHKVTMVRTTSSRWLTNGCTFRHFDVPM